MTHAESMDAVNFHSTPAHMTFLPSQDSVPFALELLLNCTLPPGALSWVMLLLLLLLLLKHMRVKSTFEIFIKVPNAAHR